MYDLTCITGQISEEKAIEVILTACRDNLDVIDVDVEVWQVKFRANGKDHNVTVYGPSGDVVALAKVDWADF